MSIDNQSWDYIVWETQLMMGDLYRLRFELLDAIHKETGYTRDLWNARGAWEEWSTFSKRPLTIPK